jgi:hypothetical protein
VRSSGTAIPAESLSALNARNQKLIISMFPSCNATQASNDTGLSFQVADDTHLPYGICTTNTASNKDEF